MSLNTCENPELDHITLLEGEDINDYWHINREM